MARTGRGRARAEVAVARVLEKRLGALAVVAQFGRRLRIAEVVDELCPVRPVAPISHGEVIEALVANRLTAPAPLVQVEAWAAAMAVDEVYGIEPHLLNDDRLGRALDAIAPHLDEVIGSVGAAAISEVGGDVARLHWDMTSISLYGAYPGADEEYPAPRWGDPKARRRAGHLPGAGGRRDGHPRPPHERSGGAPAPDPGVLLGERRRPGQGQGAEAGQGRRGTGQAGPHRRDPVPPHRRCRGRPRPGDRRQTARREVPAH